MVPYPCPCPCPGLIDHYTVSFPPARRSGPLEEQHAPCCGGPGGSMSFWLPSKVPWPLDPGVRREDDERALRQIGPPRFSDSSTLSLRFPRESGGPGAAMAQRSRSGPQRSGFSACTILELSCKAASFVPRRLWRFDVLLVAIQSSVVPGSRRSPGRR